MCSHKRNARVSRRPHKGKSGTARVQSAAKKATKHWTHNLFAIEMKAFQLLCQAVNTPFSCSMLELVSSKNWLGIANAPFPDINSDTFPDDYLLYSVMRKNPRLPLEVNRRQVAIDKFQETERACRETNELARLCSGDFATTRRASWAVKPQVLQKIKGIIADVLGPLSKSDLEFVERKSRFGPGASFHCTSKRLTARKKLESRIGLSPNLVCFLGALEPRGWIETTSGYALTRGSKATTVPKDALVDRFIAIEPSLNMRWQLGIGALIRRRLKRHGLDLKHQADRNRLRVRFAEITRQCTIDLSSASDSLAKLLIKMLLPSRWSSLLFTFRSPEMEVDGRWQVLEKISSMGNGFTFELETLIFYAVCKAFDADPYVFGDDMIVSQECSFDVIRTLNVFGFSVNRKKTFLAGSFFESCGVDIWRGRNVRPFFFKKDDFDDLTSACNRMANAVRRYAHRRNLGNGCDSRFLPAWEYLSSRTPEQERTAIPEGYGDAGIIRNFDEAAPKRLTNQHCGFTARVWTGRPVTEDVTFSLAGLFSSLDKTDEGEAIHAPQYLGRDNRGWHTAKRLGIGPRIREDIVYQPFALPQRWGTSGKSASMTTQSLRGEMMRCEHRTMPVLDWHDLGPWC